MIDETGEVTDAADSERDASSCVPARESRPLRRDTHYDWMDFHSIPELSREW
ncbi:hypothetical protein [Caballeronia insecticola]|uniref:Uncharacterized protein n=1 Tax=Caballeronia insecticola TaxID=758793 RepID=R4X3I3_9BURK|nr:hypothetical protein [Caballeronia insecticola]BAN26397.1 hypothetical protein BRPE64_CCDS03140 [Caballeronia insecticola]